MFVTALQEGKMYLLNGHSIDGDGTYEGYDLNLIKFVSEAGTIPVVALGGDANYTNFNFTVKDGLASAVATGSIFVCHGPRNAVLISFSSNLEIKRNLN